MHMYQYNPINQWGSLTLITMTYSCPSASL